jgi:hypothetical protein
MSLKRVFILGAGFSKQMGMPLATELTALLRRKFEQSDHEEALEWFAWLDERVRWINGNQETGPHAVNIEEVFDLAHFDALTWRMRQQMCPLGRNSGDTPYATARGIEAWLSYMEDDLAEVIWDCQQEALRRADNIVNFAICVGQADTVVTFNYDTLLEQIMSQAGKAWHYGFGASEGTLILKMHGSLNWIKVPRGQSDNFGYPVLFRKEDHNVQGSEAKSTGEVEYDYVLLRVPDVRVDSRISNRVLQMGNKQYSIGIAGLGRYKPLDELPGSGCVWDNAGRALYRSEEIFVVGFSLSPFDAMARLHFAGVMCEKAANHMMLPKIVIVDPSASSLKQDYQAVFGSKTPIQIIEKRAEEVDWESLLA